MYEIEGQDVYLVKMPLLHLALDRKKFTKASQALVESAVCNCEYFTSYGICKHIVAICGSLEQEFGLELKRAKLTFEVQDEQSGLSKIFNVDEEKQERVLLQSLEEYLIKPDYRNLKAYLDQSSYEDDGTEPQEVFPELFKFTKKSLAKFEHEVSLQPLIVQQIILKGKFWWRWWQLLWSEIGIEKQRKLWFDLYLAYQHGLLIQIGDEFIDTYQNFDREMKNYLFKKLRNEFPEHPKKWIDFAMNAEYWEGVAEYLDQLDPILLIKIALRWPEQQEEIEQLLVSRVRPYLEFLPTGEYEELIEIFTEWQTQLGRSVYFEEVIKLAKDLHPKKRGLLKKLDGKK
jgi:hypothetical protein